MASLASITTKPKPRFTDEDDNKPPEPLVAESILALMKRDMPALPAYIGPAVLPKGGKLLLGGEAKIGKSFLCMELARALATGGQVFHSDTLPVTESVKTLYIDQEVGVAGLRQRATTMLADEDEDLIGQNFLYVSKSPDLFLDDLSGLNLLNDLLYEVQPSVLILDPASRLLKGDDSDNTVVRAFWRNIDKLIKEYSKLDLSIVVSHHFRKPPQATQNVEITDEDRYDPYNFRGGSDWYNAPDTIETCIRPAKVPGERSWILGCQYTTRHSASGDLMYLRIAPDERRAVAQIPQAEALAALEAIEEAREERKSKKKKKKASDDDPNRSRWQGK